jgi:hypothetical protein
VAKQPEQRCGNCRWWRQGVISGGMSVMECHNESSDEWGFITTEGDGSECPCHERKETADE